MGNSPKTSAIKSTGETWDVGNLYVADSSLFPTALGINPMLTIEALAISVSRNIAISFKNAEVPAKI
jgi:choline dehydrogenase-like flavoprotein